MAPAAVVKRVASASDHFLLLCEVLVASRAIVDEPFACVATPIYEHVMRLVVELPYPAVILLRTGMCSCLIQYYVRKTQDVEQQRIPTAGCGPSSPADRFVRCRLKAVTSHTHSTSKFIVPLLYTWKIALPEQKKHNSFLWDPQRCARASSQEFLLDGLDSSLEAQHMLEGVIRKRDLAVLFAHAREQKLNSLLLRAARERSTAHCGQHLGTPRIVGDRDHFLHEAFARRGTQKTMRGRVS